MKVEIWSDIVCPFCYIGKRKFEKALEDFEGEEKVNIVWRSFQLDPDMKFVPGQSVHEYLGKRKGTDTAGGKKMNDGMRATAKEVGLAYDFDIAIPNNTMDAHRLLHFAKAKGLQNQMKERLFKAYYTEGKNIGDTETLVKLAAEIGLPAAETTAILQAETYRLQVLEDQHKAQQIGVNGVPFFVFNDKYAVSGAQPAEIFTQVLNKVGEEEKPQLITDTTASGVCTPEGICN